MKRLKHSKTSSWRLNIEKKSHGTASYLRNEATKTQLDGYLSTFQDKVNTSFEEAEIPRQGEVDINFKSQEITERDEENVCTECTQLLCLPFDYIKSGEYVYSIYVDAIKSLISGDVAEDLLESSLQKRKDARKHISISLGLLRSVMDQIEVWLTIVEKKGGGTLYEQAQEHLNDLEERTSKGNIKQKFIKWTTKFLRDKKSTIESKLTQLYDDATSKSPQVPVFISVVTSTGVTAEYVVDEVFSSVFIPKAKLTKEDELIVLDFFFCEFILRNTVYQRRLIVLKDLSQRVEFIKSAFGKSLRETLKDIEKKYLLWSDPAAGVSLMERRHETLYNNLLYTKDDFKSAQVFSEWKDRQEESITDILSKLKHVDQQRMAYVNELLKQIIAKKKDSSQKEDAALTGVEISLVVIGARNYPIKRKSGRANLIAYIKFGKYEAETSILEGVTSQDCSWNPREKFTFPISTKKEMESPLSITLVDKGGVAKGDGKKKFTLGTATIAINELTENKAATMWVSMNKGKKNQQTGAEIRVVATLNNKNKPRRAAKPSSTLLETSDLVSVSSDNPRLAKITQSDLEAIETLWEEYHKFIKEVLYKTLPGDVADYHHLYYVLFRKVSQLGNTNAGLSLLRGFLVKNGVASAFSEIITLHEMLTAFRFDQEFIFAIRKKLNAINHVSKVLSIQESRMLEEDMEKLAQIFSSTLPSFEARFPGDFDAFSTVSKCYADVLKILGRDVTSGFLRAFEEGFKKSASIISSSTPDEDFKNEVTKLISQVVYASRELESVKTYQKWLHTIFQDDDDVDVDRLELEAQFHSTVLLAIRKLVDESSDRLVTADPDQVNDDDLIALFFRLYKAVFDLNKSIGSAAENIKVQPFVVIKIFFDKTTKQIHDIIERAVGLEYFTYGDGAEEKSQSVISVFNSINQVFDYLKKIILDKADSLHVATTFMATLVTSSEFYLEKLMERGDEFLKGGAFENLNTLCVVAGCIWDVRKQVSYLSVRVEEMVSEADPSSTDKIVNYTETALSNLRQSFDAFLEDVVRVGIMEVSDLFVQIMPNILSDIRSESVKIRGSSNKEYVRGAIEMIVTRHVDNLIEAIDKYLEIFSERLNVAGFKLVLDKYHRNIINYFEFLLLDTAPFVSREPNEFLAAFRNIHNFVHEIKHPKGMKRKSGFFNFGKTQSSNLNVSKGVLDAFDGVEVLILETILDSVSSYFFAGDGGLSKEAIDTNKEFYTMFIRYLSLETDVLITLASNIPPDQGIPTVTYSLKSEPSEYRDIYLHIIKVLWLRSHYDRRAKKYLQRVVKNN